MGYWRLLKSQTSNAFVNMAVDEAILMARIDDEVPNTLRLYRWKPSAVSVGKFQKIENEVHIENCRKNGVDIVRRITGGGAVYHDEDNELTYSVVVNKKDFGSEDVTMLYAKIYTGLAEALSILGTGADFHEGNLKTCPNLKVNCKKVSGSAQCHKSGVVLQHGTVLIDVSLEMMFKYLRVPWATDPEQVLKVARARITSIDAELGMQVTFDDVEQALTEGFQKALQIDLKNGNLTNYELELAEKLCRTKYNTDEWNLC